MSRAARGGSYAVANVYKYLPGVRFSWNIPGVAFLNTDFMAYLDFSSGVSPGIEFVAPRKNEFGAEVEGHIFGQPQLRWDVGYALTGRKDRFCRHRVSDLDEQAGR